MKKLILIIIVLVVIIGGYLLLKGDYQAPASDLTSDSTSSSTPAPGTVPGTVEEMVVLEEEETPSVKEFTISGTEYSFSPSSFSVEAGDKVRVTFKNTGRIGHNFVIEDLRVSTKIIKGGETDVVEFIASASGTYTFFCSVPGHLETGMKGQLEVE